jgi:hypothetical protein
MVRLVFASLRQAYGWQADHMPSRVWCGKRTLSEPQMNTQSVSPTSSQPPSADTPNVAAATSLRQPLTKEQRDAIFAKTAASMQPARASAANELLDWKPQIMAYYAKGFSAVQIRDMLQAGGVAIGERVIQRFIAKYSRRRRRTSASAKRQRSDAPTVAETTRSGTTEPSAARPSAVSETTAARLPTVKGSTESVTSKRT